ncbi:uncharacterized protein LOC143355150 [Halictus rubicundus]|uniref:uncharacterized protein LOC143355150 n=1 Tax=Halictus rubicundus TaxID=77578 RepID=UPI004036B522
MSCPCKSPRRFSTVDDPGRSGNPMSTGSIYYTPRGIYCDTDSTQNTIVIMASDDPLDTPKHQRQVRSSRVHDAKLLTHHKHKITQQTPNEIQPGHRRDTQTTTQDNELANATVLRMVHIRSTVPVE